MEYFQYQPLSRDSKNPSIRILELLPGGPSDLFRCNLRHVTLSEHPEYEAISYCWGASLERKLIVCNDSILEITQSLFSALWRLRIPEEARFLWADAICINQSDPEEKSYQVALMRQIYQSAKIVDVWLGEAADGSERLKDFVPSMIETKQKRHSENDRRSIWELSAADRKRYGFPLFDLSYLSLLKIISRPWFGRVWIIQEISFAAYAVAYCGSWSMPWDSLLEAIEWVIELGVNVIFDVDGYNNEKFLQWTRSKVASGTRQKLLTLLLRHYHAEATDARDKLFALCGLASDSEIIEINYQIPIEAVYTDATTKILIHDQNLDVLASANLHDDGTLKGLPSWVPDWSRDPGVIMPLLLEQGHWESDENPWHASGVKLCSPVFKNKGKVLGISGTLVDEVVACGPTLEYMSHGLESLRKVHQKFSKDMEGVAVLYKWEKIAGARSAEAYITGESMLDAYWQTLCAGLTVEAGFEVSKQRFDFWDDWRKYSRWEGWLLLDVLCLDYSNWPYKVLSFLGGLIIGLSRTGQPQEITFLAMMICSLGRKMVRTRKGYIGLTSHLVQVGDQVGLFSGSRVPLIVRRTHSYCQLLGESYIHGMMQGELFDEDACELLWFG